MTAVSVPILRSSPRLHGARGPAPSRCSTTACEGEELSSHQSRLTHVCIYHVISKKNMSKRCQKDLGDEMYGIARAHSQTQWLPVLDASLFKPWHQVERYRIGFYFSETCGTQLNMSWLQWRKKLPASCFRTPWVLMLRYMIDIISIY